jgi:hypothetical protein
MPKLKSYKTLQKEFEKKTGKTISIFPAKYLISCFDCDVWDDMDSTMGIYDDYTNSLFSLNRMIEEHIEEHLQYDEKEGE